MDDKRVEKNYSAALEVRDLLETRNHAIEDISENRMWATYTITSTLRHNNCDFEFKIKLCREQNYGTISVTGLQSIPPHRYHFCLELLNQKNQQNEHEKYSINPITFQIIASDVITFWDGEIDSGCFTDSILISYDALLIGLQNILSVINNTCSPDKLLTRPSK